MHLYNGRYYSYIWVITTHIYTLIYLIISLSKHLSIHIYIYIYIYVGGQKWYRNMSHFLLITFLTNGIQTLQHPWKKYVEHKGDYVEKQTSLFTFHESILISLWTFQLTLSIYLSIYLSIFITIYKSMYQFIYIYQKRDNLIIIMD